MWTNREIFAFIVIPAVAVLCYYNSINCGFVFDDISAIKDNKDLRPTTALKNIFFNDFWGTPIKKEQSHKSYRPLTVLTFRWNYYLHELQPNGYHVVNVFLHVVACLLYLKTCLYMLPNFTSFIAALLFTVHPIHTEAVTGVVGRAEILSSIFFLAAFMIYLKSTQKGTSTNWMCLIYFAVFLLCAMLSKEQGITVSGISVVYEIMIVSKSLINSFFRNHKKRREIFITFLRSESFKRLFFLTTITLLLLLGRLFVMGSKLPTFTRFDNPSSIAPSPARQLTYNYLIALNAGLLVFPCDLCCDWTMGTIPIIEGFNDKRNLITLFVYGCIISLLVTALNTRYKVHYNVLVMSVAFTAIPFLPASNLFFTVGFVIAERILYMPSMGFCIIVAQGFYILTRKFKKKGLYLLLIFLIMMHAIKTHIRNFDWNTEYSLFMSGLKVNQKNAKLFNNVGHALENEGKYENALKYFQKAVEIQNDDIGAYINVGRTYNNLKRYNEAEKVYRQAKSLLPSAKPGESYQTRIAPNHLNVFLNLANLISKNRTRLEEADNLYKQAISMRSDYIQAYINRGDILMKLNRTKQAQEVYETALLYDNENADIHYNLGVVFLEQGRSSDALVYLERTLELNPEHDQALLNSAILLQEIGGEKNRQIAKERLLNLLKINVDNERVYFSLGMLAMDENNTEDAELWFKKAIEIKLDFRSALFNLALLLADAERPLEAVPFLNELIRYHPDHIKGLILLGDIYINHLKDLDSAEKCYRKILQLDPENIQGLHNLCVVYVERGKLSKAVKCLEHAHHLAPQEDYILKHLRIVQSRLKKFQSITENTPEKMLAVNNDDPDEFVNLKLQFEKPNNFENRNDK